MATSTSGATVKPLKIGAKLGDRQTRLGKTVDVNAIVSGSRLVRPATWHRDPRGRRR
jgi:hypothetical protein